MNTDFRDAMNRGSLIYSDALAVLRDNDWKAEFTQTGGMCGAIEVTLERGYLLVTDMSEPLPWEREQLLGWGVGYYADNEWCEGPMAYVESEGDDVTGLPDLLRDCLRSARC